MKNEKMSFGNIKDVLSRDEMKEIMAGSATNSCGTCMSGSPMETGQPCQVIGYGGCKCPYTRSFSCS